MSKTHLSKELKAAMARQTLLPHGFSGRTQSKEGTEAAISAAIKVLQQHRRDSWPVVLTAAYTAFNFPRGVQAVWQHVLTSSSKNEAVEIGSSMRETILKCVPFIGIPRVLSCIGALAAEQQKTGHAAEIANLLQDLRKDMTASADTMASRGRELWNSVYAPDTLATKLFRKISGFHPELASLIVTSSYGHALSPVARVGREDTSALAVTVLRAEEDVLDQLTSHVFGLLKGGGDQAYAAAIIAVVDNLRTGNMDNLVAKL